jgi:hypothetical protein
MYPPNWVISSDMRARYERRFIFIKSFAHPDFVSLTGRSEHFLYRVDNKRFIFFASDRELFPLQFFASIASSQEIRRSLE